MTPTETTYNMPMPTYQCGLSMGWPEHDGRGWRCFERVVVDVVPWMVKTMKLAALTFLRRRDFVMGV